MRERVRKTRTLSAPHRVEAQQRAAVQVRRAAMRTCVQARRQAATTRATRARAGLKGARRSAHLPGRVSAAVRARRPVEAPPGGGTQHRHTLAGALRRLSAGLRQRQESPRAHTDRTWTTAPTANSHNSHNCGCFTCRSDCRNSCQFELPDSRNKPLVRGCPTLVRSLFHDRHHRRCKPFMRGTRPHRGMFRGHHGQPFDDGGNRLLRCCIIEDRIVRGRQSGCNDRRSRRDLDIVDGNKSASANRFFSIVNGSSTATEERWNDSNGSTDSRGSRGADRPYEPISTNKD